MVSIKKLSLTAVLFVQASAQIPGQVITSISSGCSTTTVVNNGNQCTSYVSHDLGGLIDAASGFSSLLNANTLSFNTNVMVGIFASALKLPQEIFNGIQAIANPSPADAIQIFTAIDVMVSGFTSYLSQYFKYVKSITVTLPGFLGGLVSFFFSTWLNLFSLWINNIISQIINMVASAVGCFDVAVVTSANMGIVQANSAISSLNVVMSNLFTISSLKTVPVPTAVKDYTSTFSACWTMTLYSTVPILSTIASASSSVIAASATPAAPTTTAILVSSSNPSASSSPLFTEGSGVSTAVIATGTPHEGSILSLFSASAQVSYQGTTDVDHQTSADPISPSLSSVQIFTQATTIVDQTSAVSVNPPSSVNHPSFSSAQISFQATTIVDQTSADIPLSASTFPEFETVIDSYFTTPEGIFSSWEPATSSIIPPVVTTTTSPSSEVPVAATTSNAPVPSITPVTSSSSRCSGQMYQGTCYYGSAMTNSLQCSSGYYYQGTCYTNNGAPAGDSDNVVGALFVVMGLLL